jgi:glycosyltransferase involved in cell wall biosynthesis
VSVTAESVGPPAPKVSVCIPTLNRREYLRQAIDSVLAQTFTDFEIVISDNASEDGTDEMVRSYSDSRIRYHRNPTNIGQHGNWNMPLKLARGRYLALHPDDDMMLPRALEEKVKILDTYPRVGLVCSKYHIIDAEGNIVRENTNWGHGPEWDEGGVIPGKSLLENPFNPINIPTALFRREVYDRLGGFTTRVKICLDWEYWMRLGVHYDIYLMPEALTLWRLHGQTVTSLQLGSEEIKLWETLSCKRSAFQSEGRHLPDSSAIGRKMWQGTAARIANHGRVLLEEVGDRRNARRFMWTAAFRYPELLRYGITWKFLLKTVLSRGSVKLLKRLSPG